jgi:hypothetical protein
MLATIMLWAAALVLLPAAVFAIIGIITDGFSWTVCVRSARRAFSWQFNRQFALALLSLLERRIRWLMFAIAVRRRRLPQARAEYRSWFAVSDTMVTDLPGGIRLEVRFCEDLSVPLLLFGGWERREIEHLCSRVRGGTVAIDAGANIGLFTIPLARAAGRSGRVMAFEALPSNVELLKRNIALNGLANVDVFPVAAGDGEGEIPRLSSLTGPTGRRSPCHVRGWTGFGTQRADRRFPW